ncbi:MAG: TldD/PmbA family protein [Nitrospinota bacterium]
MTISIRDIAEDILQKTLRRGPSEAEVFAVDSTSTTIDVRDQKVDAFNIASSRGIGLRVILDGRLGFSYTSGLTSQATDRLIDESFVNAINNEIDEYNGFTEGNNKSPLLDNYYDIDLKRVSEAEKIEKAMLLEKSALNYDSRIKKVRQASYRDSENSTVILNSRGVDISFNDTLCSTSILSVAEDDSGSETGWEFDFNRFYSKLEIEKVGVTAAQKAVGMLGARRIETCNLPAVLAPNVAADFIGILTSSLYADSIQKGKSILGDKLQSNIASPVINLVDDGLLGGGIGSAPVDSEGTSMQRTLLIKEGYLQKVLHNTYTARKWGVSSTGNSIRMGFKGLPGVGVTNLFIEKGLPSEKDLIEDIKEGIYISETMGVHTANTISGDFSIGISGYRIEKGEVLYPVKGIAISGNILNFLNKIDGVADNLRFFGRIGSPGIKVSEVMISGS